MSFLSDYIDAKWYLISRSVLAFVIVAPIYWAYQSRYYLLNEIFPFKSLENKVAMDALDLIDLTTVPGNINEIYLVDTVTKKIRQLTNNGLVNEMPYLYVPRKCIYYLHRQSFGAKGKLYVHDLNTHTSVLATQEFGQELLSTDSEVSSIVLTGQLLAIVEHAADGSWLKIISLSDNRLKEKWPVDQTTIVSRLSASEVEVKQQGRAVKFLFNTD